MTKKRTPHTAIAPNLCKSEYEVPERAICSIQTHWIIRREGDFSKLNQHVPNNHFTKKKKNDTWKALSGQLWKNLDKPPAESARGGLRDTVGAGR